MDIEFISKKLNISNLDEATLNLPKILFHPYQLRQEGLDVLTH